VAADLQFRIGAELTEIKGALAALRKDFATVGQAAQQAGTNQAFSGLERSARGAIGTVGRLVAGFVTLAGAVRLIGAADELNTLNARIRLVTASTEDYNRAQVALFDLAQRTRSSLGETINLYSRIAQATKEAGVGQEVLLQVVETVNQAVQLSGSSAQAAEAALIQLGQGLASGTLRGEELNSVLEQTPALADAIAKGMGITRGELRKYGEEGKITAEQVIKALQAQRDEVARQFAELPLTVGQSVTLLRNAGLQLVGAFDQASGATSGLASVIKDLADALSDDRLIADAAEFASAWGDAVDLFVQDVRAAVEIFQSATSDISLLGNDLAKDLGLTFTSIPIQVRTFARVVGVEIAAFFDKVLAYGTFVKDNFKAIFTSDTQEASFARFQRRLDAIRTAAGELNDDTFAERDRVLADAANRRDTVLETRRLARRQRPDGFSPGTFKLAADKEAARKAEAQRKAQLDAEEKLLRDSSQRQIAILQELFEDAKISTEAYYARRRELELAALDQAIAVERQRAGAGGVERVKALAEIELLERQKGDVQRRIQREQAAAARELEQQLAQARAQELENQGRTADAERIRLEAQFRDLLARLEADGNATGVRLIRGLIDTGVAKARFDELRAQAERFIAELERRRADIDNRVRLGAITPAQGRQEESAATAGAAASLAPVNAELQALAATLKDPALIEAANRVGDALKRMAEDARPPIEKVKDELRAALADMEANIERTATGAGVDALANLFTDLASGSKSAGDALRDFVRGFAQSMAQIAARALATYLVLQLLDAVYPGLGRTVAAGMSVGANVKHSGGMAGTGPTRQMPAWLFAGAPRFHSGGMVGLKPGEVPAVLQTGEEVLSRADPRNAANGGASGGGTRIINVIDPALVQDYMTSSAGERTILNVIERNAGAVRQKLA
jgi:tape measure domain-containing protein